MNQLLRFFIFMALWSILMNPKLYAQSLQELEGQIQQVMTGNDHRKANQLLDQLIAKTNPKEQSYGKYLALKGEVALKQKLYKSAVEWSEKAKTALSAYPPNVVSISNLITLGYAVAKLPEKDDEVDSLPEFGNINELLPKLSATKDFLLIGNRLLAIGSELVKPAKPSHGALVSAISIFGIATTAFEKGNDPIRAKVARKGMVDALMKNLQREEEEDSDEKDTESKRESAADLSKKKSSWVWRSKVRGKQTIQLLMKPVSKIY